MLLITTATLLLSLRLIPLIAGQARLEPDDAQVIIQALTDYLNVPELIFRDIPILPPDEQKLTEAVTPVPFWETEIDHNTEAQPAASALPAATPTLAKVSFRMTAAGALLADKAIRSAFYHSESDSYDFSPLFALIQDNITDDINVFTLENLIDETQKLSDLNTCSDILSAAREAGFDLVALGHEKAMDLGFGSLARTMAHVRDEGFSVIGVTDEADDNSHILIFSLDGVQVAFLHYCETVSKTGANRIKKENTGFALPLIDAERIQADILHARQRGANIIIVSTHWGTGNKNSVSRSQQTAAQQIADAGADIILGAHSQALQPIVFITGKHSDGRQKQTLVAYSLGALVTSKRDTPNISSVLLHLALTYDPVTDSVIFDRISYTPIYFWRYKDNGRTIYQPVISAMDPPEDMSRDQIDVMKRALKRVADVLKDSVAALN
jgi:poly-gamma-glutamate synthesis protein (capsule biosynthesis protein)